MTALHGRRVNLHHACYAGSFDPVTLGHTSIVERAARIYERVTVAIGVNPAKEGMFDRLERQSMIETCVAHLSNVDVQIFDGLLVHFARTIEAGILLRGMRLLTDFEHELQLALANRQLAPELETVFMLTASEHLHISSSLVKEIARNGGDFGRFVPPTVERAIVDKLAKG
ncbi:MAG: pantetheine-phosphate adenylyltransferase [Deltaproteobacteria bacterium]|nr:pantetheine-phosphate adenylyltransferase [Deltaproteobacteria bacterium]